MAAFTISAAALVRIRERIAAERIERPLIAVGWNKGSADLRRDPKGHAVWEREAPGWFASIIDLTEVGDWLAPVVELHGLNFSLFDDPAAPRLDTCTLECEDGRLVVNERAI